jgi:Cys-tRNA(Pro)/Cys-tRNA(Cys) deacylase
MASRETPATRAARHAGISFAVHEYRHDPSARSYGLEAAEALGLPAARVLKTLVVQLDGGALAVCCAPVDAEVDLKAVAAAAGAKRAVLAEAADAERATGYVVGGISPLGQRRQLATIVDASALGNETIFVSAGRRGLEIELAPADLVRLTDAVTAAVARRR